MNSLPTYYKFKPLTTMWTDNTKEGICQFATSIPNMSALHAGNDILCIPMCQMVKAMLKGISFLCIGQLVHLSAQSDNLFLYFRFCFHNQSNNEGCEMVCVTCFVFLGRFIASICSC